jgi:hypothetical protein
MTIENNSKSAKLYEKISHQSLSSDGVVVAIVNHLSTILSHSSPSVDRVKKTTIASLENFLSDLVEPYLDLFLREHGLQNASDFLLVKKIQGIKEFATHEKRVLQRASFDVLLSEVIKTKNVFRIESQLVYLESLYWNDDPLFSQKYIVSAVQKCLPYLPKSHQKEWNKKFFGIYSDE